jgi:hypothetical protein
MLISQTANLRPRRPPIKAFCQFRQSTLPYQMAALFEDKVRFGCTRNHLYIPLMRQLYDPVIS